MRFQKHEFSLSSTTHRSYRVHATVLIRFRLSTLKRSKKIELPAVATLCERDKHARLDILVMVFILMCFRPSKQIRYV